MKSCKQTPTHCVTCIITFMYAFHHLTDEGLVLKLFRNIFFFFKLDSVQEFACIKKQATIILE